MKKLALIVLLASTACAHAQYYPPYGGGPYRPDPREWGPEERERRMPPWPYRNPRNNPCIAYGECWGPQGPPPPMPPFTVPRDRYEEYDD